ncbi:MAG: hypothetical protein ACM30E_03585 [Nitrososphaerales archaeon]
MAKNKRVSNIDIDQDLEFQDREWRVQHIGWVVIWVLLGAALLGAFGKGPLAYAQASDPGQALTANYTRLERYRAPTTIEVIVGPGQLQGGKVTLTFDRQFVDRIDIARVDPEPSAVKSDANRIAYEFEVEDASAPVHIFIDYEFEHFGMSQAQLGLEGGPEIVLRQFVYP